MGRPIAQTMSHHGADWLIRGEREEEENTALLLEKLDLTPGQTVCDVGAGNGYHALKMAERVGSKGEVVAVDIQPQMLQKLRARAKTAGVTNVTTVLGAQDDPKLGQGRCDLILLVDVYHEFSRPKRMLELMKAALREGGRIALVEFRAEDPKVPIKKLHKMTRAQMVSEFASVGLAPVDSFDGLPWQHLMFFAPSIAAADSTRGP